MVDPKLNPSSRGHRLIQLVLRGGLGLGASMVLVGVVLGFATGTGTTDRVRLETLFSDGALSNRVIGVGLLALALTPLARVLALTASWIHERDYRFVAASTIVAVILMISIFSGWCHGG